MVSSRRFSAMASRAATSPTLIMWSPQIFWPKAPAIQAAGQVFNVATGTRIDLNETFQLLKKIIGFKGEVKYGPERAGDVKHSLADLSRTEKCLGYKPEINFEEGLRRT